MHVLRSVVATNQIITLTDGTREVMADSALEEAAEQINASGLPCNIEHDSLRPIGWSERAWTEREGLMLRLVTECVVPENDAERKIVGQKISRFLANWVNTRIEPFRELARSLKVSDVSLTCDKDCVILEGHDLVRELCPTALSDLDDDGLVHIKRDAVIENGYIKCGQFWLIPSILLRPSFGLPNTPNHELLSTLLRLAADSNTCTVRLALDQHRLGIPESFERTEERAYWWGPPYCGNSCEQPYGITVHGPTKDDKLNRLIRTEFWWYGKRERTFEVEELTDLPLRANSGGFTRASRFVHSIFSEAKKSRHLDGAIRFYLPDAWKQRIGANISDFGKNAVRVKLWRVDGELEVAAWHELIHMFFNNNYTIGEYFGFPSPRTYRSEFERSLKTERHSRRGLKNDKKRRNTR